MCLKSVLFGNLTVIECLKSILVWISGTYCNSIYQVGHIELVILQCLTWLVLLFPFSSCYWLRVTKIKNCLMCDSLESLSSGILPKRFLWICGTQIQISRAFWLCRIVQILWDSHLSFRTVCSQPVGTFRGSQFFVKI